MKDHSSPGAVGEHSEELPEIPVGKRSCVFTTMEHLRFGSTGEGAAKMLRGYGWGAEIPVSVEEDEAWKAAEDLNALRGRPQGEASDEVCHVS